MGDKKNPNYVKDLRCLITKIRSTKMEPEVCNVSCPPMGCPRGPCPGRCRDSRGLPDACCTSKMPRSCCTSGCSLQPSATPKHSSSGNSCCGR